MTAPAENRYNGWTNYETWCVHLWLSSEQGTDEQARETVREALAETCDYSDCEHGRIADQQAADGWRVCPICDGKGSGVMFKAADALKTWVTETDELGGMMPELGASMASDLLNAALSEVNWQEIAEAFAEASQ
jgi:hypothetical protein